MSLVRDRKAPGQVRIIGGQWRGTRLPVPDAPGLRPTSDRVRETLFNWLQPRLAGARVLDLFAGTGALGLEALSRGAREALFVEATPALANTLRSTIERLHAGHQATVVRADAMNWLRTPLVGRFDVVFVDPPFDAGLSDAVMEGLPPWLADGACVYLETSLEAALPDASWGVLREGRTREVRYALYRRASGPAATLGLDSCGGAASA